MRLIDRLTEYQWAILPEVLEKMVADAMEISDVDVSQTSTLDFKQKGTTGIVKINGPLTKELDIITFLFGGTSYSEIQSTIDAMLSDPSIKQIVLDIDSPGGTVAGAFSLVEYIKAAKEKKPIYAWSDGHMTSAAYWIASAATSIAAAPTTVLGSIGVVATHTDISKLYEKMGIKKTYITGGKYKRLGNPTEPLSEEGYNYIKVLVDDNYKNFYSSVAESRGLNTDEKDKWAEGKLFNASEGKKLGLIDQVTTLDNYINGGTMEITKEYLKENFASIVAEIAGEATTSMAAQVEDLKGQVATLQTDLQKSNEELYALKPKESNLPKEAQDIINQQQEKIAALEKKNFSQELMEVISKEDAEKLMPYYGKLSNEELMTIAAEFARLHSVITELGGAKGSNEVSDDVDENVEIEKIAKEQGISLADATVEYYKTKK
jgi:signal peptide peptidase SppA